MPHLQLSAVALSVPRAVVSIRRSCSIRLFHDTVPALRFLGKAEARRATSSTTVRLGGVLRRSTHEGTAIHAETAERPGRIGAQMRVHKNFTDGTCKRRFLVVLTIHSVVRDD